MATALDKAYSATRALTSNALTSFSKGVGGSSLADNPGSSGLVAALSGRRDKSQYALYRGWLYSAVHALCEEGAGQDLAVSRILGADPIPQENQRSAFIKKSMTTYASTKSADYEIEKLIDHPVVDVLEQPNPVQSKWQFVYSFMANLALTGRAYIVGGATDSENGFEFYSLPTTWIKPDHTNGWFSEFYIVDPNNPAGAANQKALTRKNVRMAYLPDPSNPLGALAPSRSQGNAIQVDDNIQTSQLAFFENGIFPGIVVTVGRDPHPDVPGMGTRPRLTAAQRRQVNTSIKKVMGGVANYGNPAIVDGMIESIERLSATQNEMGWEKSEDKIRTRILSAYGVHPYILGEPVNVGGYAQAFKIEERFCKRINTYLDMLSRIETTFIAPMVSGNDERLLVHHEKCAPIDQSLRARQVMAARKNGDLTRNEVRAELGYAPDLDAKERGIQLDNQHSLGTLVDLVQSVRTGMVQPEVAIKLLVLVYEIPEQQAKDLINSIEVDEELSNPTTPIEEQPVDEEVIEEEDQIPETQPERV